MKFSIRGILTFTTLLALLLAAFVSPPVVASAIILATWPLIATALISMAVYGRGLTQAFATGAAIPVAMLGSIGGWLIFLFRFEATSAAIADITDTLGYMAPTLRLFLIFTCVTALFCGSITVGIRSMFREGRDA